VFVYDGCICGISWFTDYKISCFELMFLIPLASFNRSKVFRLSIKFYEKTLDRTFWFAVFEDWDLTFYRLVLVRSLPRVKIS